MGRIWDAINRVRSRMDYKGTCEKCGLSWNHVNHMEPVYYRDTSAAFPLCEECFEECGVEEATTHFRKLVHYNWQQPIEDGWLETFRENVRQRKEDDPDA